MKIASLACCFVFNTIGIHQLYSQESAQHIFDPLEVFDEKSNLNIIKSQILSRIGGMRDIGFLAVTYRGFISNADFIAIRIISDEKSDKTADPFNPDSFQVKDLNPFKRNRFVDPSRRDKYELVIGIKNRDNLIVKSIGGEKVNEIFDECSPVLYKEPREEQTQQGASQGFDNDIHCYLFMRPAPFINPIGGLIVNPRQGTKTYKVVDYITNLIGSEISGGSPK